MERMSYENFLERKAQSGDASGFEPLWMPDFLFDFQRALVTWAIKKGRCAIFADCGLGKTAIFLVYAENVARKTNQTVLVVTPLAVGAQVVREGEKFGISVFHSRDGKFPASAKIVVTNYERLHLFDSTEFVAMVCDESSVLKNYDGVRRGIVTDFSRKLPYRLLCTATAAPNDFIELGTSAEALGELGHMDMLARFFKNEQNSINPNRLHGDGGKWRFKKHAEMPFWRWVCSWARAVRRPSDLGFDDGRFVLPPLIEQTHIVSAKTRRDGWLFDLPAVGLREEKEEARRTVEERCAKVVELTAKTDSSLVWCHLNPEGDMLKKIIAGAVQIKGGESDDAKEEKLLAFANGGIRVLVTKPKIGAFGLNFQNCAHMTTFPSHSFEQLYQGIRRCWRFGQTRPVRVDTIATDGEVRVLANLKHKADAADLMFSNLVANMNDAVRVSRSVNFTKKMEAPSWMSTIK